MRTPFAYYDQDSSCLRTCALSLFEDLGESSPTWPQSGSMRNGECYEHPMPALLISGHESSLSRGLLPTPNAEGGTGYMSGSNRDTWRPTLESAVKGYLPVLHQGRPSLLKTPTAQLAVNGGSQHPDKRREGGHGPTLADEVEHLLPTPAARDWKSGQSRIMDRNARPLNEVVEMLLPTPRATDGAKWGPGQTSTGGPSLPSAVTLLPTPTVADSRNSRNATAGRSPESTGHSGMTLSDAFWTGEPTDRQSPSGKPSSDAGPPGQLSLDGLESA